MGTTHFTKVDSNEGYLVNGTEAISTSGEATAVEDGAVTTNKLGDEAVTNAKVADTDGTGQLALPKIAIVKYDFPADGGTAGTIALTGAPTIPAGCSVYVESYTVLTTCTSATDAATITLTLPTDGALLTATAISDASNPWDEGVFPIGQTAGLLAAQTPRLTTAARVPELTVAGGEDLTAGEIVFVLRYQVVTA